MRKQLRIGFSIVIVAALGGFAWLVLRQHEPTYEGKPLTVWLEGYDATKPNTPEWQKADEVVRKVGTRAIPTLLRLLRANDSALIPRLTTWAQKHHLIRQTPHVLDFNRNFQAENGFRALGADAEDAVPVLIQIYDEKISAWSQSGAASALGYIGPAANQATSSLLSGATNANDLVRSTTVYALGAIHAKPELILPTLIKALGDPAISVRMSASGAVAVIGPAAKPAVPELVKLLEDSDRFIRFNATNALKRVDPEAAAKAGVKVDGPIFPRLSPPVRTGATTNYQ
jgi:hypothetical protein